MRVTTRAQVLKFLGNSDTTSLLGQTTSMATSIRKTTRKCRSKRKRKQKQPKVKPAKARSKSETCPAPQQRSTVSKSESAFEVTNHAGHGYSNIKWKQSAITIAGGNGKGNQVNQLHSPHGIFIDDDQTIYIADLSNYRIVTWKCNATNGQIVAGGNGRGNKTNQLTDPIGVIINKENNSLIIADYGNKRVMRWSRQNHTDGEIIITNISCASLTMDKNGDLYVSNSAKDEVRRWKRGEKHETIVAGGNGKGNHLNQLNCPTYIFVDQDYSLYVSDLNNDRVMKWIKGAKEGIVVAGGNGRGNNLTQLSQPRGVIVNQLGQIYVVDDGNDRVMCWCKEAKQGTIVVGGNGRGDQSNQFFRPTGLSFDRQGHLYVADWGNHRIQKFEVDQDGISFDE